LPDALKPTFKQLTEILGKPRNGNVSAAPFEAIRNHLKSTGKPAYQELAGKLFAFEYLFINHPNFEQGAKGLLKVTFNDLKDVAATEAEKSLMAHYQTVLERFNSEPGGRRLFSLFTNLEGPEVQQKLTEMIQGGVRHDSKLVRAALKDVGTLVSNSRQYPHSKKVMEMEQHIVDYLHTFMKHLEKVTPESWSKGIEGLHKEKIYAELERFATQSQNSRYLAQWVAIPLTMVGLGILVPRLQFWLTRYLTGKEGHPGINAVSHTVESSSPTNTPYVPLVRSGFQAFSR
jgi:hypothetical protein